MGLLTPRPTSLHLMSATLCAVQNFLTLSLLASTFVLNLMAVPYDLRPLRLVGAPYRCIIRPTSDSTKLSMYNILWLPVEKKPLSYSRAQRAGKCRTARHGSVYGLRTPAGHTAAVDKGRTATANNYHSETCLCNCTTLLAEVGRYIQGYDAAVWFSWEPRRQPSALLSHENN
jgi:hypothetical protein